MQKVMLTKQNDSFKLAQSDSQILQDLQLSLLTVTK